MKKEKAINEIPSMYSSAKWSDKILFNWVFPIIKLGQKRPLKFEDMGGLNDEDLIESKVEKVETIFKE